MSKKKPKGAGSKDPALHPALGLSSRVSLIAAVGLALVAMLVYANSFAGVLIGDDEAAIAQNTTIRSISWQTLSPPPDTTVAARPVANLTFAINYAIAGGTTRLWGYHAFNLAIHLLTSLLLFGLVRRTLLSPALRDRFEPFDAALRAFAIAAVWLVHPLHTQAVTFLAQRVESLMGFFFVSTIYCVVRAAELDFRSRAWAAAAIVACALGMATKETMIGAPLAAAAWIWICWPREELTGRPLGLLTGLASTMVIAIVLASQGARTGSAGFGAGGWTTISYLRTQADVIVHYIRLAFWPHPLVFQYGWLPAASWTAVLPQVLAVAALGAATVFALLRRWPVALLGVWFFVILAPSSSIVPVSTEVAAEHRMYLPLAAVIAVVVLGLHYFWRFAKVPAGFWADRVTMVALVVPATMLAMTAVARNEVYASAESLAAEDVRNRPQNANGRLTYGTFLVETKRFDEAEPHLRAAMSLPLPPSTDESKMRSLAHLYLGLSLVATHKTGEGAHELEQALTLRPDLDRAYPALAEAQLQLKQTGNAVATLERAIERRPDDAALRKRAAWILSTSSNDNARNGPRAITHAERAVLLTDGRDPIALDTVAAAYAEAGKFDLALAAIGRTAELVRARGPADFIPTLRSHLLLIEAGKPIRTGEW